MYGVVASAEKLDLCGIDGKAGRQFTGGVNGRRLALTFGDDAGVAQLAEQLFCKQVVCL